MQRWVKFMLVLGIVTITLEGVYLATANYLLNSEKIFELINRKPERFWIHWESAWTLWPGMVRIRGVETRGQSKTIQWFAAVDKVDASYKLFPLFHRRVHLTRVLTDGIEYRQRRRLDKMPDTPEPVPGTPPIPGLVNPPDPPPEKLYPKKPRKKPWSVILDHVEIEQIRQLWLDRYRFTGNSSAVVSMDLLVRGPLSFPKISFKTRSGKILVEEKAVFSDLEFDVNLTLDPFIPRETKGPAFFDYLSGRIVLEMHATHVHFLKPYFSKTDWVHLNGQGTFRMDLGLENGVITPGSSFDRVTGPISISFLDRDITGTGGIHGEVILEKGRRVSRITARIDRFQVTVEGAEDPHILGEDFEFTMIGNGADLSNPFVEVRVILDLPESEIPDLTFYNRFIPTTTGFSIASGSGKVRYHFEASHHERSLEGEIEIKAQRLGTRFGELLIEGDLNILTRLREGHPQSRDFDISGTILEMDNVRIVDGKKVRQEGWWGRIEFPKARMDFTEPIEIDGSIQMNLKDTEPLVALFDAKKNLSRIVERLMTIKNLDAKASFTSGEDALTIKDLEITGKGLRVFADFEIVEKQNTGLLYVRFKGFSIGIEMMGEDEKDLKFIWPLRWFKKKREVRRNQPNTE